MFIFIRGSFEASHDLYRARSVCRVRFGESRKLLSPHLHGGQFTGSTLLLPLPYYITILYYHIILLYYTILL